MLFGKQALVIQGRISSTQTNAYKRMALKVMSSEILLANQLALNWMAIHICENKIARAYYGNAQKYS